MSTNQKHLHAVILLSALILTSSQSESSKRSSKIRQVRHTADDIYKTLEQPSAIAVDAAILINNGAEAYKKRRLDEAVDLFRKAAKATDNPLLKAMAYANLGMISTAREKHADAVKYLSTALKLQPADSQTKLDLANALLHYHNFKEAQVLADELKEGFITEYSHKTLSGQWLLSLRTLLGNLGLGLGNYTNAAEEFRKAIRLNPAYLPGHLGLGESLIKLQVAGEAIQAFRTAAHLQPNSDHALFALGRTILRFVDRVDQDPTNLLKVGTVVYFDAVVRVLSEDVQESVDALRRHVKLMGPSWGALFSLGAGQLRLGEYKGALAAYRDALARFFDRHGGGELTADGVSSETREAEAVTVMFYEGECLRRLDQPLAAADAYLRALELRPGFAGAHGALAQCLESAGDHSAALASHRAAVRFAELAAVKALTHGASPPGTDAQAWTYWNHLVYFLIRVGQPLSEVHSVLDQWDAARLRRRKRLGPAGDSEARVHSVMAPVRAALADAHAARQEVIRRCDLSKRPKAAVVYLCCKGPQDVQHLEASVRLLYLHFLRRFPYPVIILHDSHIQSSDRDRIVAAAAAALGTEDVGLEAVQVQFMPINLTELLPNRAEGGGRWCKWQYQGYCEMTYLFSGVLHWLPQLQDYDYLWRLDSDLFILAPIARDILAATACSGCAYAVAGLSLEPSSVVKGLWSTLAAFLRHHPRGISSHTKHLAPGAKDDPAVAGRRGRRRAGRGGQGGGEAAVGQEGGVKVCPAGIRCLARPTASAPAPSSSPAAGVDEGGGEGEGSEYVTWAGLKGRGPLLQALFAEGGSKADLRDEESWNRVHFYNNFEISKTALWQSPLYDALFDHLDRTGGIFAHRWGDSPIKTLAAVLMLPEDQICYWGSEVDYVHQSWSSYINDPHLSPSRLHSPEGSGQSQPWQPSVRLSPPREWAAGLHPALSIESLPSPSESSDGEVRPSGSDWAEEAEGPGTRDKGDREAVEAYQGVQQDGRRGCSTCAVDTGRPQARFNPPL